MFRNQVILPLTRNRTTFDGFFIKLVFDKLDSFGGSTTIYKTNTNTFTCQTLDIFFCKTLWYVLNKVKWTNLYSYHTFSVRVKGNKLRFKHNFVMNQRLHLGRSFSWMIFPPLLLVFSTNSAVLIPCSNFPRPWPSL